MSNPQLSVVVPAYNGGAQLRQCIAALAASDFAAHEIIVVDDCSTDGSAEACRARGVEVVRQSSRRGPAAARNTGAARARAPVILFVDADVVVRPDTLARVADFFRAREDAAALFGSYDDEPVALNFASRYRNLLHHFVHQRSSAEAQTFWAGCGAIRRDAFLAAGGFDEAKYARPSVEDIELGYRLRRRGLTVILDRELKVKHLKRWTLLSLVRTDIFDRALPWSRLIVEGDPLIDDLNLRVSDRVCAALTGLSLLLLALAALFPSLLIGALAALVTVFILNLQFSRYFKKLGGAWFSSRAFAMLLLYYFYSGTAFVLVYCSHLLKSAGRGQVRGQHARTDEP